MRRNFLALPLAALVCGPFGLASHAYAASGEQWEYTQKMEMRGMQMPMPPMKVCEKADREFIAPVQKGCKVELLKKSADKVSWKFKCDGPDAMEGEGWSAIKGSALDAEMDVKGKNGNMHIVTTGKKLGACELPK